MSRRSSLIVLLLLATAMVAGCSYTPARVSSEPLIVIDDERGGHSRSGHSHGGDFCPPGQAKKGRC